MTENAVWVRDRFCRGKRNHKSKAPPHKEVCCKRLLLVDVSYHKYAALLLSITSNVYNELAHSKVLIVGCTQTPKLDKETLVKYDLNEI
jgi:hypothetical protein